MQERSIKINKKKIKQRRLITLQKQYIESKINIAIFEIK